LVGTDPVADRNTAEGLMPWSAVQLNPGVDTQKTLSANQAGVSQSQTIRYKEGMIQTLGGWQSFYGTLIGSTARDLHPWQDANGNDWLSIAATGQLSVINSGALQTITPQTVTTNPVPNFSISTANNLVTIVDANANASLFNTIYLNTPVAIGGWLLNGAYPINSVGGSTIYTILLSSVSNVTVNGSGILPVFSTSSGTASITVTLPNNGFQKITGLFEQFIAPTTVGTSLPLIVQGKYQIASIIDSTSFTINAITQASTTATATMNGGDAQIVYYVTLGPAAAGSGFGSGGFGSGGFGSGTAQAGVPGIPITTTDWTQDNWGEILISCPTNGPIYIWSPDFGFQNAQVITSAPFFNGGIFVSMPQQILVAWRSVQSTGVQDQLTVRWSNQGDYTNWAVTNQTTAGSFRIPTGSTIVAGLQCPQYALISTDIDVWTMTYVGGVVIFNFTRVGTGCGFLSSHACGILAGNPLWIGINNFYTIGSGGVTPLPCSVWDQVFQNLSVANQSKIRVAVNSAFNEVAWFYPSAATAGENDSYVKVHIEGNEYEWDYGTMTRTAWTDVSILGMPLGVDNFGQIWQHETGTTITGAGLPAFQTGYFTVAEGEEIPVIDFIIPDFIFGLRSASPTASINITFFGVNYPGDAPTIYGPYTVTSTTEFINCRIRNRLLSAFIQSNSSSEFWRIGCIRFRFGVSGRR
jgi:hypothetical protein